MLVFSCNQLTIELPTEHRFPMEKYALLDRAIEGISGIEVCRIKKATRQVIEKAHSKDYVQKVYDGSLSQSEIEILGFPWFPALLERSLYSVGCSVAAALEATENQVSCSLAGGTHHAGYDYGAGFCVFNDAAVASAVLLEKFPNISILIVDTDVHQGNGTAEMLKDNKSVFTFSIHSARNYPHEKAVSDLDISLPDRTKDEEYLEIFHDALEYSIDCAKPNVILFLSGADIYERDKLGRLDITKLGVFQRDTLVFKKAEEFGIKVAAFMGGGYAPLIADIVEIHKNTVVSAFASWKKRANKRN